MQKNFTLSVLNIIQPQFLSNLSIKGIRVHFSIVSGLTVF